LVPAEHGRAALLPFENLAGREAEGTMFTKIFFAQLTATNAFEMVEPTRVEMAMDSVGVRSVGGITPAELQLLGNTLQAPYVLIGSVLESGKLQSGYGGQVPAVGATLRLVDARSGKVLWAGVHFRDGGDHETVFGWGRELSSERLALQLATEMLSDFQEAGSRYTRQIQSGGST
jgi:TolB-like protein